MHREVATRTKNTANNYTSMMDTEANNIEKEKFATKKVKTSIPRKVIKYLASLMTRIIAFCKSIFSRKVASKEQDPYIKPTNTSLQNPIVCPASTAPTSETPTTLATANNLKRFIDAQNESEDEIDAGHHKTAYEEALAEMKQGIKTTHWIWYIFPQVKGRGKSDISIKYELDGVEEAMLYLQDQTLGPRLANITKEVLAHKDKQLIDIMVISLDVQKFHSSMEIFNQATQQLLDKGMLPKHLENEQDIFAQGINKE